MSPLITFCWGFAGSVAVEIVALLGHYQADARRLPRRYRRSGFWITRSSLAVLGGALAVGYGIEAPILAFNIGAATPLIITSLARGIRPQGREPRVLDGARAPARPRSDAPGSPDSVAKPPLSRGGQRK
jgi:hypothetical protein